MTERKQKPKEADFVSKVVEDPASFDVVLLRGFLGASSEEAHTRLYGDASLASYLEIPTDSIRHIHELEPEASLPLGGAYVWIDRGAELIHGPDRGASSEESQPEGTKMHSTQLCPIPTMEFSCYTRPFFCPWPVPTAAGTAPPAVPPAPGLRYQAAQSHQHGQAYPVTYWPGCTSASHSTSGGVQASQSQYYMTRTPDACPPTQPPLCPETQAQGYAQTYWPGCPQTTLLPGCQQPRTCSSKSCPWFPGQAHHGAQGYPVTYLPGCPPQPPTIPASQYASVPIVCC